MIAHEALQVQKKEHADIKCEIRKFTSFLDQFKISLANSERANISTLMEDTLCLRNDPFESQAMAEEQYYVVKLVGHEESGLKSDELADQISAQLS